MSKKFIFVAQIFMTFIMAASMSGLMGLIFTGFSMQWLADWPQQFLIAWPIAFVLTMFTWPASMAMARFVLRPRASAAGTAAPEGA